MSVTGYLALYTTLIGWQQYQNLWTLMVNTGLVFLPFIGILLKCFLEPFESQEPKSAAVIALRRLMIRTISTLLVIEFCCVPTVPLAPKVLHFEPVCTATSHVATPGHTGTTYDNEFTVPTGVNVPIIWYLVMAVSNGFTHAAIEMLGCPSVDYQTLQNTLNVNDIDSVKLRKETIAFYNGCYVPAYSKYMSGNLSNSESKEISNYQKHYGKTDIAWIGSKAFLNTSGFYNNLSASSPVRGFSFNPERDQFEGQTCNHPKWGEPNCVEWWDAENGLNAKLEKALPQSFLQAALSMKNIDNITEIKDAAVRQLISNSFDHGMSIGEIAQGYETLNDSNRSGWMSDLAGKIGIEAHKASYYPKLYLLINALPVIQALLLLGIYAFLAILIPFSSYQTHFIITGAATIFAVTFWSYLWHLVSFINNALIGAIYPVNPNYPTWHALLQMKGGIDATLVHFIIGTLYIVFPMLFLALAGSAGLKISQSIAGMMNQMQAPTSQAGQEVAGFVKAQAVNVVRQLIK